MSSHRSDTISAYSHSSSHSYTFLTTSTLFFLSVLYRINYQPKRNGLSMTASTALAPNFGPAMLGNGIILADEKVTVSKSSEEESESESGAVAPMPVIRFSTNRTPESAV